MIGRSEAGEEELAVWGCMDECKDGISCGRNLETLTVLGCADEEVTLLQLVAKRTVATQSSNRL